MNEFKKDKADILDAFEFTIKDINEKTFLKFAEELLMLR